MKEWKGFFFKETSKLLRHQPNERQMLRSYELMNTEYTWEIEALK